MHFPYIGILSGHNHWLVLGAALLVALVAAYAGSPLLVYFGLAAILLYGYHAGTGLWIIWGALVVLIGVPPIRKIFISAPLVFIARRMNLLPSISETEKVALRSGNVWVEGEFFTGKPDFKRMLSEPYPELSKEEQAFLDGPCEELCRIVDDWSIYQDRDLPPKVWDFLKKKKFFGMIIAKKYGGLGFTALGHSAVIQKLASRSLPLSVTVMVPNSLGPAELLTHYGTDKQKSYYLPRLADGREIPCFALTEPVAGSDAASIQSYGDVIKGKDGKLYVQLTWEKRYITLASVSTILGLAFRLRDPGNLLGKGPNPGITCALLPSKTKGVILGRRHDPMFVPFHNAPTRGDKVLFPLDVVIGGIDGVGRGWQMLMECLGAGRGISLPGTASGGAKLVTRLMGSYGNIRKQFGLSVGKFEGIEEALARIGSFSYLMEAARRYTCGALDKGMKPAVVTAVAKYQFTELFRRIINDGMDVQGGAGISQGPRNLLGRPYIGMPISITVEGANIMTRALILFGQGAIRCHPYAYQEIEALAEGKVGQFDRALFAHIVHIARNAARVAWYSLTRAWFAAVPGLNWTFRSYQKIKWASATFALMTDIALILLGGGIKRKEKINGRFGDALSWLYLAVATLRRYEAEGRLAEDKPYVKWSLAHAFREIQVAFEGLYQNIGQGGILHWIFAGPILFLARLNPLGLAPSDKTGHQVAKLVLTHGEHRDRLTKGIYVSTDPKDALGRFENAFNLFVESQDVFGKITDAVRSKKLPRKRAEDLIREAQAAGIITKAEAALLEKEEAARLDAVQVDSYSLKDYLRFGKA